jgi:hypothetical protein
MLDETLLDDADALARADTRGLLLGVAAAGARVRTAARLAAEAGVGTLRPDGHPRTVLVAGPGPGTAGAAADLIAALGGGSAPVLALRPTGPAPYDARWTLPGWAGPVDLLLVATPAGTEAGLAHLIEQAYRRGCTVATVAPADSPIAEATTQARGMLLPYAPAPYGGAQPAGTADTPEDPGAFWALLTPLLALTDRLGLLAASPGALEAAADRLDSAAARCGPAIATYANPAKTLAAELSECLPVLWSDGPVAAAAARRLAALIASRAGRPALHGDLPEALDGHAALLAGAFAGGLDPDDFFRDRVEDPGDLRVRVVLLTGPGERATSAAPAARDLALTHDTPLSEIAPAEGSALEAAVELLAVTDFAAVYLALSGGAH